MINRKIPHIKNHLLKFGANLAKIKRGDFFLFYSIDVSTKEGCALGIVTQPTAYSFMNDVVFFTKIT